MTQALPDTPPLPTLLPWRLRPGVELRDALQGALAANGLTAAFVLSGIGSLGSVRLRLAGASESLVLEGDFEVLSLAGSLSPDGPHLHISVADATGRVLGGHVAPGCIVRTTAEVLLMPLAGWHFSREPDAATGFAELVVRRTGR